MALIATGQVVTSSTPTPLSPTPIGAKRWQFKAASSNASLASPQCGFGPKAQIGGAALSMSNCYLLDPGDYEIFDGTIQPGAVYGDVTPDQVYVVGNGGIISWSVFG